MGRKYRSRRSSSVVSVVKDVVHIASRLPWWGALLTGLIFYFLVAILLGGYIEGIIASQSGNKFHFLFEARYDRLLQVCNWVGITCFIVGVIFAIRNYFVSSSATGNEKGVVALVSKLLGRIFD